LHAANFLAVRSSKAKAEDNKKLTVEQPLVHA
jgi:hypothetical protein